MAMHLTTHGCIHLPLAPSIWSITDHRLTYARRLNLPTHTCVALDLVQCPFRTLVSTKRAARAPHRATSASIPVYRGTCGLYTSVYRHLWPLYQCI